MPATAPTPGAGRRIEIAGAQEAEDRVGIRITCGSEDRTVEIYMGDIGAVDEADCLRETGLHPAQIFGGVDNLTQFTALTLYWLACRKGGQPNRSFKEILTRYGQNAADFRTGGFVFDLLEEPDPDDYDTDDTQIEEDLAAAGMGPTGSVGGTGTPGPA